MVLTLDVKMGPCPEETFVLGNAHLVMSMEEMGNLNIAQEKESHQSKILNIAQEKQLQQSKNLNVEGSQQLSPLNVDMANQEDDAGLVKDISPQNINTSPTVMDRSIQAEGQELQEVLRMFKQATTDPISTYLLQTPRNKVQIDDEQKRMEKQVETRPRKSPRLKDKKSSGKSMVKLA
jgi:hypothetical protein